MILLASYRFNVANSSCLLMQLIWLKIYSFAIHIMEIPTTKYIELLDRCTNRYGLVDNSMPMATKSLSNAVISLEERLKNSECPKYAFKLHG